MNATKEVGDSIQAIQKDTRGNVEGVDKAALAVERSSGLAAQSGVALKEIVGLVVQTTDRIGSIATAAEQQSAASEAISNSVQDVQGICKGTTDEMGQASAAVARLEELARSLREVVRDTLA